MFDGVNWPATATVGLTVLGLFVAYANNLRLEKRKAEMKFLSDQLQYLYGPLFALTQAADEAWNSFMSKCRPGEKYFFGGKHPLMPEDFKLWRLWMAEVFMPINLKMEEAVVQNTHLIEGGVFPDSFRDLIAHVEGYKVIRKKCATDDFSDQESDHVSSLNYPDGFNEDIKTTFAKLKVRQARLLGRQFHDE